MVLGPANGDPQGVEQCQISFVQNEHVGLDELSRSRLTRQS
jgi:hypothetical protein